MVSKCNTFQHSHTAPAQLIDGLTNLQRSMANTLDPKMLDVPVMLIYLDTLNGLLVLGELDHLESLELLLELLELAFLNREVAVNNISAQGVCVCTV